MDNNIHRILDEIESVEQAKTLLVDELDRLLNDRYREVFPEEGEVWEVTITSERGESGHGSTGH